MNKTVLLELLHRKTLQTGIGERTRSLLLGLGWTMPAAIFSRVICGLTTVLAARTLGPSGFGLANLSLATTLWVQVPLFLGVPTAIMHFAPRVHPSEKSVWIVRGVRLMLVSSTLTLLLGYGLSPLWSRLQGVRTTEFNAGLVWCLGFLLYVCATTIFNAQENFKARAVAEMAFASLFPAVILWPVLDGSLTPWLYVAGLAAAYGIAGIGGLAWSSRSFQRPPASVDPAISSSLLRYGALASVGAVASALSLAPGRIVANQYLSLAEVGILSAYVSGSIQMGTFLLGVSSQIFFPIASRTPDKEVLFRKMTRLMLTASPLLLSSLIAGLVLYFLILGKGYPWQVTEAVVFSVAALLTLFHGILGWYLASYGQRGLLASSVIGILAGVVNVGGCLFLIPNWKILGAGTAAILSSGVGMFLCCLPRVRRYSRVRVP